MIRIFGDFNALSEGRLPLFFKGSTEDIRRQNVELSEGLRVILYDDQYQAEAVVHKVRGEWYGWIIPGTGRVSEKK
jgi:hypothetical protein